jgi:hypothetical protein
MGATIEKSGEKRPRVAWIIVFIPLKSHLQIDDASLHRFK